MKGSCKWLYQLYPWARFVHRKRCWEYSNRLLCTTRSWLGWLKRRWNTNMETSSCTYSSIFYVFLLLLIWIKLNSKMFPTRLENKFSRHFCTRSKGSISWSWLRPCSFILKICKWIIKSRMSKWYIFLEGVSIFLILFSLIPTFV